MTTLVRSHLAVLAWLVSALLCAPASAQDAPRPAQETHNVEDGVALGGYDPVSYYPCGGGRPEKGARDLTARHGGVVYRFASEAHRALFLEDPGRFEPAYGGWCAYAMAKGERVEVDPQSFLIQDGELLVFYDGFLADTRKRWRKGDVDEQKASADREWRAYSGEQGRDVRAWNLSEGVALGGFDPVAACDGQATLGTERHVARYRGVTYRFAGAEHRERFLRDPGAFEPRCGGWDAQALADGRRVATDGGVTWVHEGRLYAFADTAARGAFQAAVEARRPAAEERWRALSADAR